MSWTMRVVVLATALLAVTATSASAVTWINSGDTAFTATGGGTPITVTGSNISCSASSSTGTVAASPFTGSVWPAATITTTYTGCFFSVLYPGTIWECTRSFTAVTATAAVVDGVAHTTCDILVTTGTGTNRVPVCHVSGSVVATYANPVAPSTPGRFTLPSSTLQTSDGPAGTCPIGSPEPVTMGHQALSITAATGGPVPHLGPNLVRTA